MRVRDEVLKASVISQHEKPFAVVIKTTRGSNLWKIHEVFEGGPPGLTIRELGEDLVGFIKEDQPGH
jgi:hypothetical protein